MFEEMQNKLEYAFNYRNRIIEKIKIALSENPDKLNKDEIVALSAKVLKHIEKVDITLGFIPSDLGLKRPETVSEERQNELFLDFIDWYEIVPTSRNNLLEYVLEQYPKEKYPRILCVGDGMASHLGRKLAMRGYRVLSVDPEARDDFETESTNSGGSLRIEKREFNRFSKDLIDEASLVVGVKVPKLANDLVTLPKPTVFNIDKNAELREEISKCNGVRVLQITHKDFPLESANDEENYIFVHDGQKQREKRVFPEEK